LTVPIRPSALGSLELRVPAATLNGRADLSRDADELSHYRSGPLRFTVRAFPSVVYSLSVQVPALLTLSGRIGR